jgi:hypothetical protein
MKVEQQIKEFQIYVDRLVELGSVKRNEHINHTYQEVLRVLMEWNPNLLQNSAKANIPEPGIKIRSRRLLLTLKR